jgi:Amt family ammonium transporter
MKISITRLAIVVGGSLLSHAAIAQAAYAAEVGYMLSTLLLLICGVLVVFMVAGFALREAGMVRSRSVAVVLAKHIALYSIASIMFFLVGHELMYGESVSGIFGQFKTWTAAELSGSSIDISIGQPSSSSWFFQMVFVAIAASVVSGALAGRVKFWPFAIFVIILSGLLYPIVGHWTWAGGWLSKLGFADLAGSTIVHSVGGWAALAGILLLGSRRGRFDDEGRPNTMAPSSLPLVTLGTFILWLGWFGINGGSQLSFSTPEDALTVSTIFVNTNAGAAGGIVSVAIFSQLAYRRLNLRLILNGALAGLVSISADPVMATLGQALLIGAVGGLLMMVGAKTLEQLQLDDVVGAIPVHLVGGIWGTLAVCFTNPDTRFAVQLAGVVCIGLFAFFTSYITWKIMRRLIGIRFKRHTESDGGDMTEIGLRAYKAG